MHSAENPDGNRPALLRLEDVGPGGAYRTLENLGRLRAVFDYLFAARVPFHVALIPRWKNIEPDGTWYEKGIDDPFPDDYVKKFVRLMQDAQKRGALLGMHGYTHQYGTHKKDDNNQDTGTGSEFNVDGEPETVSSAYTVDRVGRSLAAFQGANLAPHFWETPHYNNTPEQERIFGSFVKILYQSDALGRAGANVYVSGTGIVYIPTPLYYIDEQNTVERMLAKLPAFRGLASMFYHPFLEFACLEPAKDMSGQPAVREGLPVYRYRVGEESNLHKLVKGFRQRGFRWVSIYDVMPHLRLYPVFWRPPMIPAP